MNLTWREIVRSFKEAGLFAKAEHGLDPAIDTDSEEARLALQDLASSRLQAAAVPYDTVELALYPDGERRHDCLYGEPPRAVPGGPPPGDPRRAHLVAWARPRGARAEADDDRFEWKIEWDETGRARVESQQVRLGRIESAALAVRAAEPLKARLDRLRERPPVGEIVWASPDGSRLKLRARPALAAIAELAGKLAPALLAEAERLAAALEGVAGAASTGAAAEPPAPAPLSAEGPHLFDHGWLPHLAGRKGSLRKLVAGLRCAVCGQDHPGDALVERPYDTRQGGLWGETGVAFECPRGHAIVKIVET